MPGAMRAGFAQFNAFPQDAIDNKVLLAKGKLTMPVLAAGGEAAIIPDSGHWITEENPAATTKLVVDFLNA
jgi:pimeloyl-ACP methyl ester carboxylesterase